MKYGSNMKLNPYLGSSLHKKVSKKWISKKICTAMTLLPPELHLKRKPMQARFNLKTNWNAWTASKSLVRRRITIDSTRLSVAVTPFARVG
jgi:hypothetical protein